jgi:hypothetical protein
MTRRKYGLATLGLALLLAAAPEAEPPKIELSDGKYPLWEIRPLDRRVYVVSLDGKWKRRHSTGVSYQLTVRFLDGTTYSHRPINDNLFALGEMRFMVPEHLLLRTGAAKGGKLTLFVTERPTAGAKAEKISNSIEIDWPLKRPIARRAPATKFTPARPIDDFPLDDTSPKKAIEEAPPPKKVIEGAKKKE